MPPDPTVAAPSVNPEAIAVEIRHLARDLGALQVSFERGLERLEKKLDARLEQRDIDLRALRDEVKTELKELDKRIEHNKERLDIMRGTNLVLSLIGSILASVAIGSVWMLITKG